MPPLSVVIITYNEEKMIGKCLESVQDIADEIVVVDSLSTDNTRSICKQYNVKFIEHAFEGHIQQKNLALSHAVNPHVLSLDADEVVSPKLKESIKSIKQNWENDGYYFNRLTNYCGKWIRHCGWYPDKKLRLLDRRKGQWGGVNPHDKIMMEKNSRICHLKGDLWHYSFFSIGQHIEQINKFTDISSCQLFEQGKKASVAKILFSPFIKFIRDYIVKAGFLDGFYGLVISMNSAHAKFLKYSKLKKLHDAR
jgi:glycosyltransferase involved in cell wall biosynthesis